MVQAYDSVFPDNRATVVVNIFVLRNNDLINFINPSTYTVRVNEYRQVFEEIFRVNAVDNDGVSNFHFAAQL